MIVAHLVEIVLIQLAHEACEVRVLEHPRQYRFCELSHVFDDEAVAPGVPGDDAREEILLEDSASAARVVISEDTTGKTNRRT